MRHLLHLRREPFQQVSSGQKTIELRLYDRKRQKIAVGDEICFMLEDLADRTLTAKVKALHRFGSFEELYANLPLDQCGYDEETIKTASWHDMEQYYPLDIQKQFGVLGIEFELERE